MENDKTCPEHVTVDLTGVGGWEDFWGRIQTAFVFSDGFGKNWDAFWDVLSKECPASKVTVVGANRLRRILQRNQEFREKLNEPFDYEFVDA